MKTSMMITLSIAESMILMNSMRMKLVAHAEGVILNSFNHEITPKRTLLFSVRANRRAHLK